MKRGLFIAFEGIDGCGKSTQIWKLAKYISQIDKHNDVCITRNPWKDVNIRKILQSDNDAQGQAMQLAHLFTKDRMEQMRKLVAPNIKKGVHVITDRYAFSTLAYQQTQGIPLWKLLDMHKGLPIPDVIFIVDAPSKIAVERMKKDKIGRAKKHKFEKNADFLEKLRQNYLKLATLNEHSVVVIDGTKSINEIFEKQIKPAFDVLYSNSYPKQ